MRLFPREEKFFDLLEQLAGRSVEAAHLLQKGVRADMRHMQTVAGEIKRVEHEGDRIVHHLFTRLNQTFVTPIDPEDLNHLGSKMDDILDYIEDAAFRLTAYKVDPVPKGVPKLADLIHSCTVRIEAAIGKLKTSQGVSEECVEINRLENEADDLVRELMAELFSEEKDPITLIKHKEMYELLEAAADACEDVADVLQTIIVKNS